MYYSLYIEEKCKTKLKKFARKNPEIKKFIESKTRQILTNPHRFKSLRPPLQNKKRIHVLKSFVLIFDINEKRKIVRLLDFCHHDKVYKIK